MSSIDKRIVQMQFDNQGFENGVSTTMKSLSKLNESLKMKDASTNLGGISNSMQNLASIGLAGLTTGVNTVTSRFSALGVMGVTALMNITNSAVNAGKSLVKSLTIEPVTAGFSEYETKMNAIQTILTNTASKGTTMEDVTAVLGELNKYADKTIYNFAEMTRNIGTFTAAGIDLETSATAIKGIANLAAGSGSNAQQASTAMYQLSQALAAGKVSLQDWNSVVNAGMGGELFQNALKETAKQMGIYVDKSKPFRETLQDGWLTAEVLTKTLTKFAEDESLLKAATEVKTFTQLLDTMKESVQSGWATSWEYIIGDKEQAASFFTAISDGFNKMIQPSTDARNAMLKFWNEHGGRTAVIEGLSNVMESFQKVMRGIGMAWEMVFPPMTGQKLVELSNGFKELTEKFKITDQTAGKIGRVFKGLFDAMAMVGEGVVSLIKGIAPLKDALSKVLSNLFDSIASFAGSISDMRAKVNDIGFFEILSSKISAASGAISSAIIYISDRISSLFDKLYNADFSDFFTKFKGVFDKIKGYIKPFYEQISSTIESFDLGALISAFTNLTKAKSILYFADSIRSLLSKDKSDDGGGGLLGTITSLIDAYKGIGEKVSEVLETTKESIETFQEGIKVNMLLKIAGAMLMLAGALLLVSSIDSEKLKVGLAGMAGLFAELAITFALISKFGTDFSATKAGTTLITFAIAVMLLSSALKKLSDIDPEKLSVGLIGMLAMVGILKLAMNSMIHAVQYIKKTATGIIIFSAALLILAEVVEKLGEIEPEKMINGLMGLGLILAELALFLVVAKFGSVGIASAVGILILSQALLVLSDAVKNFGDLDEKVITKGLIAIGALLAELALFSVFSGSGLNLILLSAGMIIMAEAMKTLTDVMKEVATMQWGDIAKGLTAIAGALIMFGVASATISGIKAAVVGAGLYVMAGAIEMIVSVLQTASTMKWEEIGKGMVAIAGSLLILSVAMYAMSGCLVGAAAMIVAAGALALLTPQLILLSTLSLTGIGLALLAMAGAFTVLGLAGLLLTPIIPSLLGLSGVIVLIGAGATLCGAGLTLIAGGIAALGVAVGGSGYLVVSFLRDLLGLLPELGLKLGEMVVNMAKGLGDGLTEITKAIETILMAILTAIQNVLPKVVEVTVDIVAALCEGLAKGVPMVARAALELVLGVLQAIADNIYQIVTAGADCVIGFMDGMAEKLPGVIESGINLALSFIEGVASGLENNKERMGEAIRRVIKAMLTTGVEVVKGGLTGFIQGGKELLDGLVKGVKENWPKVKEAVKGAVDKAKAALSNVGTKLVQAGKDLVRGFINGIKSMAYSLISAAKGMVQNAIDAAKNLLGINSPSRVFMEIGKYTGEGLIIGLDKCSKGVTTAASDMADKVVDGVKNPLSNIGNLINGDVDMNPVITPVVDLSNVENSSKRLGDMFDNTNLRINGVSGTLAGGVGRIQNRADNSDVIAALKDLKDGMSNNTNTYNINGVTYDDGSNVASAVETLVRAARIERRV